ncbi:MAG: membrane or secreted protein [Bacteroidota bacterium]
MKRTLFLLLGLFTLCSLKAQSLVGAWEAIETDTAGQKVKHVMIFTEDHYVSTWFDAVTGAFKRTQGGSWKKDEYSLTTVTLEFDSKDSTLVGESIGYLLNVSESNLTFSSKQGSWTRIDDGTPGALAGAWLMSGRKRDGEIQERDTNRPRKTMKILSGTRFQWIAYNTETTKFMGTGGGSYTTQDGKYTENIEFFSRDNSRVGASLEFNFEVVEGKWHHSGLSSKGAPLYEIWSQRK